MGNTTPSGKALTMCRTVRCRPRIGLTGHHHFPSHAHQSDCICFQATRSTLNGAKTNLAAYTINGSNYFKLRDLAKALKGLDSEFEVKWNAAQQRIDLTSRTAYTASRRRAGCPARRQQGCHAHERLRLPRRQAAFPHRLLHRRQQLLQAARPRFRARLFRGLG